jgi:CHAD domain-containing protein
MPVDPQRNQEQFRKLARVFTRVRKAASPDSVHKMRTGIRRVETLLEALEADGRNERRLLKRLQRLRRRGGRVRDLDVQAEALRNLKIETEGACKNQVVDHLRQQRGKQAKKLVSMLDGDLPELRKRLRRAAARLAKPEAASQKRAPGLDPLARALRQFAAIADWPLNDQNLHEFRLRCKRIRYTAEMAGDKPEAVYAVQQLKNIQDAIGAWHDWTELTATAVRVLEDAATCPLVVAMRNVTRAKLSHALRVVNQSRSNLLPLLEKP